MNTQFNFYNTIRVLSLMLILSTILLSGCKIKTPKEEDSEMGRQVHSIEKNYVDVMELKKATFMKQILCNGRLESSQKSALSFGSSGKLIKLNVAEGDRVEKGDIIAELDRTNSLLELEISKLAFQKAEMDLEDKLLDFGYRLEDRSKIPTEVYEVAVLRSGFAEAEHQLMKAEKNYYDGVIIAPFNGKIALVEAKLYETPKESVCTILDDSQLRVNFTILESELNLVRLGQKVKIIPFNDQNSVYEAVLETINPLVEDNGQVRLSAKFNNRDSKLVDGQNVKIIIEDELYEQLVVPKSAVVLRDNMDVLFKYNQGKTIWTYVNIVLANKDSYIIAPNLERNSSIEVGDSIIISGNLNIGDNTSVEINN